MAKVHHLKRKLKRHARGLHSAGNKFISHTRMTAELAGNKTRKKRIEKQLKILENALKKLCKMEKGE